MGTACPSTTVFTLLIMSPLSSNRFRNYSKSKVSRSGLNLLTKTLKSHNLPNMED